MHNLESLQLIKGIGKHLLVTDVSKWLDPFILTVVSNVAKYLDS
jgi:hypothetical protein